MADVLKLKQITYVPGLETVIVLPEITAFGSVQPAITLSSKTNEALLPETL